MSVPLVTVLVTVLDGERHLRESLDSILGQTFRDFELVVVDDGSTDSTPAVLASYGDRVTVLRNDENLGVPRAANRGLAMARGRFVARQDADDVSDPERLERQVAFLEAHPEVALVACAYRRIDPQGRVTGKRPVPLDPVSIRWRLLFLNAFTHSSLVFRRDAVEAIGGYSDEFVYAHDYDLICKLARRGPLAALAEPMVSYRRSESSVTTRVGPLVDDVDRISRDNVRRLGGGAARVAAAFDREAAWRLLFSGAKGIGFRRAAAAARDVLAIQKAFGRREGLGPRHRAAVAAQLLRAVPRA
jgi:glycosyltransferase involved in cell wall biosynthesis